MSDFYHPPEAQPECDERHYWDKRFRFASWLFLILTFFAIFTSETAWSALVAITASVGFYMFNTICQIRHIKWHLEQGE